MNTGVIVYIIGDPEIDMLMNHIKEIAKLDIKADMIEFISPTEGYFDINDIWMAMVGKGMNKIILASANITKEGKLELTGKELQLRGNV